MHKKGFTLAEVLVTLGIIGVVAALTVPALEQNVAASKIGPSLARATANFENAVQLMLTQEEEDSITNLMGNNLQQTGENSFGNKLSKYVMISHEEHTEKVPTYKKYNSTETYTPSINNAQWSSNSYVSDDGMVYYIFPDTKIVPNGYSNIPSNQKIGEVYVDINGYHKPNRQTKDLFRFYLYNDGTLRPYGGKAFDRTQPEANYAQTAELYWAAGGCNEENGPASPDTCAGSIFDNNLHVIYD